MFHTNENFRKKQQLTKGYHVNYYLTKDFVTEFKTRMIYFPNPKN